MRPELNRSKLRRPVRVVVMLAAVGGVLSACSEQVAPRNFADFMEDRIAREGTLARCNANRESTLNDIECANARRAAAAIALRRERERREALERESEMKLAELRQRLDEQQRRAEAVRIAEEQAYEELWRDDPAAAPGALLEPVRVPGTVDARAEPAPAPAAVSAREESSRMPGGIPDASESAPAPQSGPVLEEVVVPSRFGWRPAID